ncbi:phospholipase A [Thalassolituus marinus]|uniref:Phospholipase A1 n=1 Tax=Thalassolituus marinus TaxID=671053 RepID=A0ABS7ZLU3_9GAMM|nr:phospholipase A [Thalassolituus marinus]MCA6062178.1 phospholipase A [Thalassolituus marinus]
MYRLAIATVVAVGLSHLAVAEEPTPSAAVPESAPVELMDELESLLPESGTTRTQAYQVETIAEDEIKEDVRRIPAIVEKIQVMHVASKNPYVLIPHRPNYVLPLTWQARPSDAERDRLLEHLGDDPDEAGLDGNDHFEAVFQLSIKYLLAEDVFGKLSRIEVGYTNRSFWQAYNSDISRPFRETNHEPELMFSWQTRNPWVDYFSVSLNHQSNGQTSSLSRSWNRVILSTVSVIPSGVVQLQGWWRVPEEKEGDPWDPEDNDNPDIDDYMGPGQLTYMHVMKLHTFSVTVRNNFNFDENRGALELGWSFPLTNRLKGYVHYFNGYGESLIDYNRYQERFGLGIKLSDWF